MVLSLCFVSPVSCCCCCSCCCCSCCYYWPWVWSQHIVLELPRFVTSCCLCILIFPFVSFVHFFFFFWSRVYVKKDALHNTMKQCVRRKVPRWRDFFFSFSNVVYFFVHYLLPNLVLLTPLVNEPEGLVICYKKKATSKLFSFFGKSTFFCVCVLHYFIIATSSHAFFFQKLIYDCLCF